MESLLRLYNWKIEYKMVNDDRMVSRGWLGMCNANHAEREATIFIQDQNAYPEANRVPYESVLIHEILHVWAEDCLSTSLKKNELERLITSLESAFHQLLK